MTWTREEALEHLRTSLFDQPTTSHQTYNANRGDGPSARWIMLTFGTWNAALAEAGITPTHQPKREYRRMEGRPEVFVAAIIDYIVENPDDRDPSFMRFVEWRRGRTPGAEWLRKYCGLTWNEAKSCALQELDREDTR